MGTESAITENLVQYAIKAWAAGNDVQAFAGNELRSMIQNFLTGAAAKGNELDVNLGALRSLLDTIDEKLVTAALDARDRDAWVRRVGEAMRVAGTESRLQGPVAPGSLALTIHTTDTEAIDLRLSASNAAGADLAAQFAKSNDSKTLKFVRIQLAQHANDPAFAAGLFNNLEPNDITRLLAKPESGTLLVLAFEKNLITPAAATKILDAINHISTKDLDVSVQHLPAASREAFLNSLADNPLAASNFVKAVGPDGVHKLLHPGYVAPIPGLLNAPLKVLTAHLSTLEGPEAKAFIELVGKNLPDYSDIKNIKEVEPELKAFLSIAIPKIIGQVPPSADGGVGLEDWAAQYGKDLNALGKYVEWIEKNFADDHARQLFLTNIVVGTIYDLTFGRYTGPADSALGEIKVDDLKDGLSEFLANTLASKDPSSDPRAHLLLTAAGTLLFQLANQGRLTGPAGPLDLSKFTGDADLQKQLKQLTSTKPDDEDKAKAWEQKNSDARDFLAKYKIDGKNLTIDSLLYKMNSRTF